MNQLDTTNWKSDPEWHDNDCILSAHPDAPTRWCICRGSEIIKKVDQLLAKKEEEKKELIEYAEYLFSVAEEIIKEAKPLYDYGDDGDETPNEIYTVVDFERNLNKFRAKYSPQEDKEE